jgi:hypothetical protein
MKIVAPDKSHIDYFTAAGAVTGIRVSPGKCQLLLADGADVAVAGEPQSIPVPKNFLDSAPPPGWTYIAERPPLAEEAIRLLQADTDDVYEVLTGLKDYDTAAAG